MFNMSWSELVLVGFILFLVMFAGRVGRVGEIVAGVMRGGRAKDDPNIGVREKEPPA